ncbi:MAG TPA: GAF domain-containing protein [Gaiellaceae bacterium]|jgi:GAF domain-containing protein
MENGQLEAAIATAALPAEEEFAALLRSIVVVARAIFGAQASSILLLDDEADELVFAAVANEAEQSLLGRRFPSSQGIAGWVLSARTPLVLEDVRDDPRFSRDVAERTGYVPKGLMAVPLLHDDEPIGVLQVLDRPENSTFSLAEMELLGLFATQASTALALLRKARRARALLEADPDAAAVAAVARALERREGAGRDAARALLDALARVLT